MFSSTRVGHGCKVHVLYGDMQDSIMMLLFVLPLWHTVPGRCLVVPESSWPSHTGSQGQGPPPQPDTPETMSAGNIYTENLKYFQYPFFPTVLIPGLHLLVNQLINSIFRKTQLQRCEAHL